MMHYTFQELQWAIGGSIHGITEGSVHGVATDSRTISQPRGILFFALNGPNHNGHDFIVSLYKRGVRRFVIAEIRPEYHDLPDATFFFVENTLTALQQLAAYHRMRFGVPIVAITGSNGKTIVKEWLTQLLADHLHVSYSPRSFNSQVGVPLSVLGLSQQADLGVYEAGISQPGEMEHLANIIHPTLGVFTNLGYAHQENFPSLAEKGREKLGLFKMARQLIICADHPVTSRLATEFARQQNVELITWSRQGRPASIQFTLSEPDGDSCRFTMLHKGLSHEGVLPFGDSASIEDAFHALVAAITLGQEPQRCIASLARLTPIAMRLERRRGANGLPLINDSYSCDIEALQIALDFFHQQAEGQRKTLILSDILQTGRPVDELYQEVSDLLERYGIDQLIGVGPSITSQRHRFPGAQFYPSTDILIAQLKRDTLRNSAVLLKGGRSFGFERVCHLLEKRTHRTVLEISMKALEHNLTRCRASLNRGVKLLALVKAYAYGNGHKELGQFLEYHKVDYLGVAIADEGVALRRANIKLPIIVLNPEPGAFEQMVEQRLEPEIFSTHSLELFHETLERMGVDRFPIHIKLDTGMHRVGFTPENIDTLLAVLTRLSRIRVASVFTHLAAADDPQEDEFTLGQINLFSILYARIADALCYRPIRHVLNSAGIERFPQAQYDMVRLGIGLHGVSVSPEGQLEPVATLRSYVQQVKHLQPGDTVGYGRHGKITEPTTIATLPIGYADGLTRRLGRGVGAVQIAGQLCPTIGNICMDTCMVVVTGLDVQPGDEAVIFGANPTISQMAEWAGTIPYEILATVSPRVPRVYFSE
ncbi:MAG: bifunctional UDP-N-acetylmuramoyl-tripeptide:D-alanyl-D-alanine ligase/alanine racemase [Bacteroidia bacterium]|nr:MAG: bifunctional UDP-N-acetylmuramoyl-tripeptide:D-alanyl-D-alanine ligase/alanine racemase [Bacteroidia bacterium]